MAEPITLHTGGVYLVDGETVIPEECALEAVESTLEFPDPDVAREGTIAYGILAEHNTSGDMAHLKLRFDALASHDITYVGVIQTAKASGMTEFPVPYVLTNCHNTLCAVGGTINEDDHVFGLSAAKKYGGIFVPPHIAVIHQYMREMQAGCGKMILGTDSHTRYGALGTMAIGEGGGELVKQLLCDTYDVAYPRVVAVYLKGAPQPGVGPQDIALAIIRSVFACGYVKNSVMEFVGPGIASMPTDYRNGVDVMTTETTCLTSIWRTDEDTAAYLREHGRGGDYRELNPARIAYYDGCVEVDLSAVRPMIALPFHPSNAFTIDELNASLPDILREVEVNAEQVGGGRASLSLVDKIRPDAPAGPAGRHRGMLGRQFHQRDAGRPRAEGKELRQRRVRPLGVSELPARVPRAGGKRRRVRPHAVGRHRAHRLLRSVLRRGRHAGEQWPVHPPHHSQFPQPRGIEAGRGSAYGSRPHGRPLHRRHGGGRWRAHRRDRPSRGDLGRACRVPLRRERLRASRVQRVRQGRGGARACVRSQHQGLARDGAACREYPPARRVQDHGRRDDDRRAHPLGRDELVPIQPARPGRVHVEPPRSRLRRPREGDGGHRARAPVGRGGAAASVPAAVAPVFDALSAADALEGVEPGEVEIGSMIYAVKPGDGSAREQAASCQRVLGGLANITREYATKRYRSNVMNWGMVPFQMEGEPNFEVGDYVYVPGIRSALDGDLGDIPAWVVRAGGEVEEISLFIADMTPEERAIVKAGCLINYNRDRAK